jgi:hypothetical protein
MTAPSDDANFLAWDRDLKRYRPVTRVERDGDKIVAVWVCDETPSGATGYHKPIRLLPDEVMLVRKSFRPPRTGGGGMEITEGMREAFDAFRAIVKTEST